MKVVRGTKTEEDGFLKDVMVMAKLSTDLYHFRTIMTPIEIAAVLEELNKMAEEITRKYPSIVAKKD